MLPTRCTGSGAGPHAAPVRFQRSGNSCVAASVACSLRQTELSCAVLAALLPALPGTAALPAVRGCPPGSASASAAGKALLAQFQRSHPCTTAGGGGRPLRCDRSGAAAPLRCGHLHNCFCPHSSLSFGGWGGQRTALVRSARHTHRHQSWPAAGPDCWPCACCWRSLPGLRVPPAHPAGPRAFWVVTAGSGAPAVACVGLFWGAVGHGRARCELAVVGHCNAVNNHLDDV